MPLYIYGCCGREIEVIQGIDKDSPECPDCGAKMKRLPTSPAIITIEWQKGVRSRSKGYKEDYAKDYRRRLAEKRGEELVS